MPPLKSKTMQCSSVLLAPFRVNSHFTFLRMDHLFVSSTAKAFHILLQDFKFRSVIFSALQRKKSTSSFRTSRRSTFTSSRYRLPPPPFTTEGMTTRVSQKKTLFCLFCFRAFTTGAKWSKISVVYGSITLNFFVASGNYSTPVVKPRKSKILKSVFFGTP